LAVSPPIDRVAVPARRKPSIPQRSVATLQATPFLGVVLIVLGIPVVLLVVYSFRN
jgi:hypothetical protein